MTFNILSLRSISKPHNISRYPYIDYIYQRQNLVINFIRFYQILLILVLGSTLAGCTKLGLETANQKTIDSFDTSSITKVINDLIQLDIDTYHAYMHAAKELKTGKTYQLFKSFAADHERHVTTLSKVVLDLGGHPPSFLEILQVF